MGKLRDQTGKMGQPTSREDNAPHADRYDLAIVGGGLAGALTAWAVKQLQPDLKFVLVESANRLGGTHTWSFHDSDLPQSVRDWLAPLIVHQWSGQDVRFPTYERSLSTGYQSITTGRLSEVISADIQDHLVLGTHVDEVKEDRLILAGHPDIHAAAVLDARGFTPTANLDLGYQKFVGQEIRFAGPHGLDKPIIMDATVSQIDGYRFVYVLPYDERTALVEDTRYSDGDHLDTQSLHADIDRYIRAKGWQIETVLREEEGVLPIALGGDFDAFWPGDGPPIARAGMSAALFHPLTGYSLPHAATLALKIAALKEFNASTLTALTRDHANKLWKQGSFYRLLGRMLYRAAEPELRYKVMERFYKLPQPLIERLYAGQTPITDQARILIGKPPVPIGRAIKCLRDPYQSGDKSAVSDLDKGQAKGIGLL